MATVMAPPPEPKSRGIDYSRFDNIEDSDDEKPAAASASPKEATAAERPHCHNCHKEIQKTLRCGVCKRVEYCSADCQKDDWRYHKRACKKPGEPKAKDSAERKPPAKPPAERERKGPEDKVVENEEEGLTWYKHREWKPTGEPKKEFVPVKLAADVAEAASPLAAEKPTAGSAWNAAGTWEDKDVTAFAQKTLKEKLASCCPEIEAAGGVLSAEDVDAVEGEASKPVIRGKMRHMFDLSFKVKFVFKWMDSSGQRKAEGHVEVADFTNDVFAEGVLAQPALQLSFKDAGQLDGGRKQAVEAAIGSSTWPPAAGSLLAHVAGKMEAWGLEYQQAS